ncbi:pentapeptide repeat-containing protein [Amycolatopsis sp. cg9]|uniref:pentapeptide repeat-containing protein n=1 Tax=Amycolatopsis sp. cg9 TaxID=3238801 RepID=UPI00352508DB
MCDVNSSAGEYRTIEYMCYTNRRPTVAAQTDRGCHRRLVVRRKVLCYVEQAGGDVLAMSANDDKNRPVGLRRWWDQRSGTWWWATLVIVLPVALITATALITLLTFVDVGHDPKDRIEVIKTGLTVGAGTGGIVALILTGRRQWATEHDNRERRLTELYVKAVEQLGSEKAPVRHGGLYALARVGQDNPSQRQNVVDVLCAYLRAPYVPPGDAPVLRLGLPRPLLHRTRSADCGAGSAARDIPKLPTRGDVEDEARQEREVRLTAQRLLVRHLYHGDQKHLPATFWAGMNLDLTGAVLIDLDLSTCRVNDATFTRAKFSGPAEFAGAEFAGDAEFGEAEFGGDAWFSEAKFGGATGFAQAKFGAFAGFGRSKFCGEAVFTGAEFGRDAGFAGVEFGGYAWFGDAKFGGDAVFIRAKFGGVAGFAGVEFGGNAEFDGVELGGDTGFDCAKFATSVPAEVASYLASRSEDGQSPATSDDKTGAPDS